MTQCIARSPHATINKDPYRNKVYSCWAGLNIGFVKLGLLYDRCDFGKSICLAVNCGDDTDYTGATVGAHLGIMKGRIPVIEPGIKNTSFSADWIPYLSNRWFNFALNRLKDGR